MPPPIVQRGFEPMTIDRPARSGREGARPYRAKLVEAEDRRSLRGVGGEGDDPLLLGRSRGRGSWPRSGEGASAPLLSAGCAGSGCVRPGCPAHGPLAPRHPGSSARPGRALGAAGRPPDGSAWRGRRALLPDDPAPLVLSQPRHAAGAGTVPRPSIPSALKRARRSRTVMAAEFTGDGSGAQPIPTAHDHARVRARRIQSPGAWRLLASLRTWRSSRSSKVGAQTPASAWRPPSGGRVPPHFSHLH